VSLRGVARKQKQKENNIIKKECERDKKKRREGERKDKGWNDFLGK